MFWKSDPNLYPPYLRTRVRTGKGIGEGIQYKPWLTSADVPSQGTCSCVKGILVPRTYDLLSELEATYFFLLERRSSVVDVREQWPILDISRTLELCVELGVRHKYQGIYPEPVTIDFLITEKVDGKLRYRAASIKTPKDAANPTVRQRLALEYKWCQERGIPWTLVDTSRFTKTLLESLRFIRGWFLHRYQPDEGKVQEFARLFLRDYAESATLGAILVATARSLQIDEAIALDMLRYCAWEDSIPVSLEHPIALNRPLVLLGR